MRLIIFFILVVQFVYAKNYNIADLGADGTGKVLCTALIQKAIDECSDSGGGQVIIPSGKFLTGTIFLKDNVNLNLESGAVLLGSTDINDYKPNFLIRAIKAKNISITGYGEINGQGHTFWEPAEKTSVPYDRPPEWKHKDKNAGNLIELEGCEGVRLADVKISGSERWTVHLLGCNSVLIRGITIENPLHGPNTDGIDIQACKDVRISDCEIFTRDDGICIKNRDPRYYDRACENITVTNCIITTICNGFKIGTESIGDFRNIVFSNSIIKSADPNHRLAKEAVEYIDLKARKYGLAPSGGIAIESVDGADLEGVIIDNIRMENVWCPIFVRLANRGGGKQKVDVPVPGVLSNVIISNIIADNASIASSISAIDGYYIEDIMLRDIMIKTQGGEDKKLAGIELGELAKDYPDPKMWGRSLSNSLETFPIPISGLFVRHVNGIQMHNIQIKVDEKDERPLIKLEDVKHLYLNNLQTNQLNAGSCVIDGANVQDSKFMNMDLSASVPVFRFKGKETNNIVVHSLDQKQVDDIVRIEPDVPGNSIKCSTPDHD